MLFHKKIAFFGSGNWEKEYIKKNLKGYTVKFFEGKEISNNINDIKDVQIISLFIYSKITKEILDKLPKLQLIAAMSTGYDHIDLEECQKRGIAVCNVPTYGENTVAEHTFALILSLSRKIFQSIERTKKRNFNYEGLKGFDLKDKTIGLIGTGHISAHVARIAYGFDMKILGYDIKENSELIKNYGIKYVDLNTLLKNSDVISLHLPLNDKTKYTINRKNISLIKPTAIIINTARGGLIETKALVKALHDKKVAGAGLDVLEEENCIKEEKQVLSKEYNKICNKQILIGNNILLKLDNVIITPHNAFHSVEALSRILETSIENIKNFEKNPQNIVTNIPKHI